MTTDFEAIRNWIRKAQPGRAIDALEADLARREKPYALYQRQLSGWQQELNAAERSDEITQEQKQLKRNQISKRLRELTDRLEADELPTSGDRFKDLARTGSYALLVPFFAAFAFVAWLVESVFKGEIAGIFTALLILGFVLGGIEGRQLSGSLDDHSFYKSYVKRYTQLQASAVDGREYLYTPDRSYRYHPATGVELVPPDDKIQAGSVAGRIAAGSPSLSTTGAAAVIVPLERIPPNTLGTRAVAGGAVGFTILYAVSRNPLLYLRQMWSNLSADRKGVLIVGAIAGVGVGYLGGRWLFTRKEPRPGDSVMEGYYADPEMMAAVYADKAAVLNLSY